MTQGCLELLLGTNTYKSKAFIRSYTHWVYTCSRPETPQQLHFQSPPATSEAACSPRIACKPTAAVPPRCAFQLAPRLTSALLPTDPQLSDSILPKLVVSNTSARLEPLQPQLTATEQRGWGWRWSRGALTGNAPHGQGDAVRMRVVVEGEGLAFVRGARMQGCRWQPLSCASAGAPGTHWVALAASARGRGAEVAARGVDRPAC